MQDTQACYPACPANQESLNTLTCHYDADGQGHLIGVPVCVDNSVPNIIVEKSYVWGVYTVWIQDTGSPVTPDVLKNAMLQVVNTTADDLLIFDVTPLGALTTTVGAVENARRLQSGAFERYRVEYKILATDTMPPPVIKVKVEELLRVGSPERTLWDQSVLSQTGATVISFQDLAPAVIESYREVTIVAGAVIGDPGGSSVAMAASVGAASLLMLFGAGCCVAVATARVRKQRQEEYDNKMSADLKKDLKVLLPTMSVEVPEPEEEADISRFGPPGPGGPLTPSAGLNTLRMYQEPGAEPELSRAVQRPALLSSQGPEPATGELPEPGKWEPPPKCQKVGLPGKSRRPEQPPRSRGPPACFPRPFPPDDASMSQQPSEDSDLHDERPLARASPQPSSMFFRSAPIPEEGEESDGDQSAEDLDGVPMARPSPQPAQMLWAGSGRRPFSPPSPSQLRFSPGGFPEVPETMDMDDGDPEVPGASIATHASPTPPPMMLGMGGSLTRFGGEVPGGPGVAAPRSPSPPPSLGPARTPGSPGGSPVPPRQAAVSPPSWRELEDGPQRMGEVPAVHTTARGRQVASLAPPVQQRPRPPSRDDGRAAEAPRPGAAAQPRPGAAAQPRPGAAAQSPSSASAQEQAPGHQPIGSSGHTELSSSASVLEVGDFEQFLEDLGGEDAVVDTPQSVNTSPMPLNMSFGAGVDFQRRRSSRSVQESVRNRLSMPSQDPGAQGHAEGSRRRVSSGDTVNAGDTVLEDRPRPSTSAERQHSSEDRSAWAAAGARSSWSLLGHAPKGLTDELPDVRPAARGRAEARAGPAKEAPGPPLLEDDDDGEAVTFQVHASPAPSAMVFEPPPRRGWGASGEDPVLEECADGDALEAPHTCERLGIHASSSTSAFMLPKGGVQPSALALEDVGRGGSSGSRSLPPAPRMTPAWLNEQQAFARAAAASGYTAVQRVLDEAVGVLPSLAPACGEAVGGAVGSQALARSAAESGYTAVQRVLDGAVGVLPSLAPACSEAGGAVGSQAPPPGRRRSGEGGCSVRSPPPQPSRSRWLRSLQDAVFGAPQPPGPLPGVPATSGLSPSSGGAEEDWRGAPADAEEEVGGGGGREAEAAAEVAPTASLQSLLESDMSPFLEDNPADEHLGVHASPLPDYMDMAGEKPSGEDGGTRRPSVAAHAATGHQLFKMAI